MSLTSLFSHYFHPQQCCICHTLLQGKETITCPHCDALIRRAFASDDRYSPTARLFWGYAPIMRGGVLFAYQSDEPISNLLVSIKYRAHAKVCRNLGQALGCFYLDRQFFEGIDLIVPVPLSRERFQKRGYNQSEEIAKGIADVTGLRVETHCVQRCKDNRTQTHLTTAERMKNVEGIFQVTDTQALLGKHILIVDDIVTTGATVGSLITTISSAASGTTFSIMALGRGGLPSFCI